MSTHFTGVHHKILEYTVVASRFCYEEKSQMVTFVKFTKGLQVDGIFSVAQRKPGFNAIDGHHPQNANDVSLQTGIGKVHQMPKYFKH